MTSHSGLAAVMLAAGLFLAGCSSAPPQVEVSPIATPVSTATPDVDVDLDAEFRKIVDASCDKAYAVGVTEEVVETDSRLILVPLANAYKDFTAAVVTNDGGISPIWSTEDFAVCIDSINFSMAEDGGSTYAITVTGDLDGGRLQSTYSVEDYGVFVTDYVINDGLIAQVLSTTPEYTLTKEIRYGMPSDTDILHFHEAIDDFLADQ